MSNHEAPWVSVDAGLPKPDHTKAWDIAIRTHYRKGRRIKAHAMLCVRRSPEGWKRQSQLIRHHVTHYRQHTPPTLPEQPVRQRKTPSTWTMVTDRSVPRFAIIDLRIMRDGVERYCYGSERLLECWNHVKYGEIREKEITRWRINERGEGSGNAARSSSSPSTAAVTRSDGSRATESSGTETAKTPSSRPSDIRLDFSALTSADSVPGGTSVSLSVPAYYCVHCKQCVHGQHQCAGMMKEPTQADLDRVTMGELGEGGRDG